MDTLNDVIKYLYLNYPYKNELSKARVVKMVYLADWKSAMLYQRQLTSINWYFNHYGPYVSDIINAIRSDSDFTIDTQKNIYGETKELIRINEKHTQLTLSDNVKHVLDFVIEKTAHLYRDDFIKLVYSTYPIVTQPRYSTLNLVQLASLYKQSIETK